MNILQEAGKLVHGDRQADYGHPAIDWARTAKIWSAILGVDISPQKAIMCMVGLKLSRECSHHKRDNLVDICGYTHILEILNE